MPARADVDAVLTRIRPKHRDQEIQADGDRPDSQNNERANDDRRHSQTITVSDPKISKADVGRLGGCGILMGTSI